MERNVFDQVAGDYEKIHDRSLPPGVHSHEFVKQRAANVIRWICDGYAGEEFCYLDFGCGNGRLFKWLIESGSLRTLLEHGRLRLFGFDTSAESLKEAKKIAGDERVCFAEDLDAFPRDVRFDLVIASSVFHHIAPAERGAVARTLHGRMKPKARLAIWEHNPFNPIARVLVKWCPFDKNVRLLTLGAAKGLFESHAYRHVQHAYVNIFPPHWQQLKLVSAIEGMAARFPLGAQYWVMFERDE